MKKFDVVIVLGFDVTEDGLLPDEGKSRVQLAADILRSGEADLVLFSGDVSHLHNYKPHKSEAESMRDYAIALGVREDSIILEPTSRDTYENAVFCKRIVDSHDWQSILVITSDFHLPRAKHLFEEVLGTKYTLEFQTCGNRLNATELELIQQMEKIKTGQLYNLQEHIENSDGIQMQALLTAYLKQRSAS